MNEAAKLVNKTTPIPDYPGEYVIQLDVFHQLHCLVSTCAFYNRVYVY